MMMVMMMMVMMMMITFDLWSELIVYFRGESESCVHSADDAAFSRIWNASERFVFMSTLTEVTVKLLYDKQP